MSKSPVEATIRRPGTTPKRPPVDLITLLSVRLRRQTGQTMAEYAIVLAVISAAIIGALVLLSGNIESVLSRISSTIK